MSITRLARPVEIPLLERCGYRAVRQRGGLVEMEPVPEPMKPLAVDLFCGLGGWTEGLLAEGWDVIGFDNVRHEYGEHKYPGKLVIQDVLTLHGSQFRDAALIVASPPCQGYSYRAMPWKRAKALPPPCNALFEACFRIQREACEAAGRHIPLIVENVRGAQPWVGRARWNFGSFYLWGDVPALMPPTLKATKVSGFRFDGSGRSFQTASVDGVKMKDENGYSRNHPDAFGWKAPRTSSKSNGRKFASAMIAKIPLPLSRYIARTFKPDVLCTKRKEPAKLPDWDDLRGIAPDATGDLNSEEFVRKIRSEWPDKDAERLAFEVMANFMGSNV